jgi:hypothetical protein
MNSSSESSDDDNQAFSDWASDGQNTSARLFSDDTDDTTFPKAQAALEYGTRAISVQAQHQHFIP